MKEAFPTPNLTCGKLYYITICKDAKLAVLLSSVFNLTPCSSEKYMERMGQGLLNILPPVGFERD